MVVVQFFKVRILPNTSDFTNTVLYFMIRRSVVLSRQNMRCAGCGTRHEPGIYM